MFHYKIRADDSNLGVRILAMIVKHRPVAGKSPADFSSSIQKCTVCIGFFLFVLNIFFCSIAKGLSILQENQWDLLFSLQEELY